MSSVSIVYKFQSFKVKVASNDSLNGALESSISHFKLQKREGSRFILFHNKTPVALDLPWRFLNLPAGANLELLELGGDERSNGDAKAQLENIKVRFIVNNHYGTMMLEIDVQESVMDVLKRVASAQEWDKKYLQSSDIVLQIISKRYQIAELEGHTFQSLGILESVSVRVTLPESEEKETAPEALDSPQPSQEEKPVSYTHLTLPTN